MIRMIFILMIILMIVLDGVIINCYLGLRKKRYFLDKKKLRDKIIALVSTVSLIALVEFILMVLLGQTPIPIIYVVLIHILLVFIILTYYIGKYMGELSQIKDFNTKHQETAPKVGKIKGRDVDIKRKH